VIAGCDDRDGFGVSPTVILWAAEKIKRAHGHGQVRFLGHAGEKAGEHRGFDIGINVNPTRVGEDLFHLPLVSDNQKIDHVAGIALFVSNAPRNFAEKLVVDAGHGRNLASDFAGSGTVGGEDFEFHFVGAVAGIDAGLIDAEKKFAADWRDYLFVGSQQKGLRKIGIANSGD